MSLILSDSNNASAHSPVNGRSTILMSIVIALLVFPTRIAVKMPVTASDTLSERSLHRKNRLLLDTFSSSVNSLS